MKSLSNIIKKNFVPLIILSTLCGLIFGHIFNAMPLKTYIPYTLFIIVFPMFLNVKLLDFVKILKHPKPVLFGILINAVIIPIYSYSLGMVFFSSSPELLLGFLLIGIISSGGMTASWTGFANGNVKSAVVMMSINLMVSILIIPLYLNLFMGSFIKIDNGLMVSSLLKSVIIPLVIANVVRHLIIQVKSEEYIEQIKPLLSVVSSFALFTVVFIAIALKSHIILNNLEFTISIFLPLVLFYAGIVIMCHIVGNRMLNTADNTALVYSAILRNLKIALAIALSISSDSMAALIISLAILVQHLLAAVYMNYVKTVCTSELDTDFI